MEMSESITEIAAALATSQASFGKLISGKEGKVKGKSKSGREYDYTYTYANLADALTACRATLGANGIAIFQEAATGERSGIEVTTMLMHTSGQWIRTAPLFMPVSGGAQDVGSAVTYARRYALLAAVGLAPEDDDGAGAQSAKPKEWGRQSASRQSPPRPTQKSEPLCSGKGGHIAIANTKHRNDYARLSGRPVDDVWAGVLTRCRVPAINGRAPEPHELTVKHGLEVRDKLKAGLAKLESEEDPLDRQPGDDDPADVEPPADWEGHSTASDNMDNLP